MQGVIILGLIAVLILIPLALTSDAILWDLIIQVNVENAPLFSGDSPIISGNILDHASKPVKDVNVHIITGEKSIFTLTDEFGKFRVKLGSFNAIPGNYAVNVIANTEDGKTGMTSTEFQIKGELTPITISEEKLSTPEATKYLSTSPKDFEKNPIGLMLYNYYQKLFSQYLDEQIIYQELTDEQIYIEQQKIIVTNLREQAIIKYDPKSGTYSGYMYDRFVDSLDPTIKDTILSQLNYTTTTFAEANQLADEILVNGGTKEDARKAYLAKLTITRELMEKITLGVTDFEQEEDHIPQQGMSNVIVNEENTDRPRVVGDPAWGLNQPRVVGDPAWGLNQLPSDENQSIFVNLNNISIEIEMKDSIINLIVNGTRIKFFIEDDNIIQIFDNSKNDLDE